MADPKSSSAAAAVLLCLAVAAQAAAKPVDGAAQVAVARAELELARGEGYYLVLDAGRKSLDLMVRGAVLREWTATSVEIGHPYLLFAEVPPPAGWELRAWTGGKLAPRRRVERSVVVAPEPGADAADAEPAEPAAIPPTPEELFPAPDRWRLRFAGGLALEVVTEAAGAGLGRRLADGLRALGLGGRDAVRIRLRMPADEAGALYRALPDDVGLVARF